MALAALDVVGLGAILLDADSVAVETPADTDAVIEQTPCAGDVLRLKA